MRALNKTGFRLAMLFLAGSLGAAPAQTPSPTQANQLMQLMLTQPPVDVTSPVEVKASFDPPAVRPGQKAVYRITLSAIASNVRVPEKIPAPPQLEFKPGVQGQIQRVVGNALRPFTSINYEVRASAPGMFLVPSFYVEVYGRPVVVPAAGLEVAADVAASEVARQLVVRVSASNVYVGEPLTVQVLLPSQPSGAVDAVRDIQINGDGLMADKNGIRQTIAMVEWNGRKVPAYVYEASVTPIAAGKLRVSAQGFASGRKFAGPIAISGQTVIPGDPAEYVLLGSDPVTLNVRMLPPGAELPGFKGAIGQLSCDPPQLLTNRVTVGEPLELFVAVRGDINLLRLVPPDPPRARGWQSFPPVNRGYVGPGRETNAGVIFAYTFIPLSDELRATPPIPFSAFDPKRGVFVDLTIPSLPVTVRPDATYTNPVATIETRGDYRQPPRKLALSGLANRPGRSVSTLRPLQLQAWFVGIQVAPALVFAGLWWWERRRRYLELHPEIVRRRRARRDLRQAKHRLRRAAEAGVPAEFAQSSVNALRIACAPHFPANPRALVCADVLAVLSEDERRGEAGHLIRQLFTAADAKSFGESREAQGGLLRLTPGLNVVLTKLEARL